MDSKERDKGTEQLKVDYVVHEGIVARMERIIRLLIIVIIILIAYIAVREGINTYERLQYDYADYEVTADGSTEANYANLVGGDMDGDIYNGSESKNEDANAQEQHTTDENESQS